MKADAVATRMSVLTRALPMRILVVDDDELELTLMADRLTASGFEVERAANGEAALQLLSRQWMPLVITDWQMPVMDGIQLTQELRARGVEDTYVIMLTMRETGMDYERGYLAGVDDYLTKKLPDAELFARIHAGFNTLALRRSLQETRAELMQAHRVDPDSGAASIQETLARLQSEIRRAQRYGRMLSVLSVGVHLNTEAEAAKRHAMPTLEETPAASLQVSNTALAAVVKVLQGVVRTHVDWVGRIETPPGTVAFAVVLPEAATTDGPAIKERVRAALKKVPDGRYGGQSLTFDYGLAGLERGSNSEGKAIDSADLIDVAEQCRHCSGHAGPEQLGAVQRSVSIGVTIACRHGYAVVSHCNFKANTPPS
jgi:PleD family two-component response regulator